jgi:hypothetical protein
VADRLSEVILVLGGLALAAVMGILWGIGAAIDNARGIQAKGAS